MPHAIPQTHSSFYRHRVKWAFQTHLTEDLKLDVINKSRRLKSSVDKNGNFRNNGHCVLLLIKRHFESVILIQKYQVHNGKFKTF